MSGVIVNYNNNALTSMSSSGTKTLLTSGKYCEGNFEVVYSEPTTSSLTVTPTESQQTFNATGVYGYKPVTVNAISSTYIGTNISRRDGDDIVWTLDDGLITVPSGYYSDGVPLYINTTWHSKPTIAFNSTTGVFTATHEMSVGRYVPTTYSSILTSTHSLAIQFAQTIYPSTADQTIASYRWLTGTQTIKSVTTSNLTAENIAEGVVVKVGDTSNASRIIQVTGTHSGGGKHTCTIKGSGINGQAPVRVVYNNTNYYQNNSSFQFSAGETITCTCIYGDVNHIYVNGESVATTEYTYTLPDEDIEITMYYDVSQENEANIKINSKRKVRITQEGIQWVSYVKYNNTYYYTLGEFEVFNGETIQLYCGNGNINNYIYVNGELVNDPSNSSYTYTISKDVDIQLSTYQGGTGTLYANEHIIPSDTLSITSNGRYNVYRYASASVNIEGVPTQTYSIYLTNLSTNGVALRCESNIYSNTGYYSFPVGQPIEIINNSSSTYKFACFYEAFEDAITLSPSETLTVYMGPENVTVSVYNSYISITASMTYYTNQWQDVLYTRYFRSNAGFEIPERITHLGQYAFAVATNLKSITGPNIITMDGWAFYRCYTLAIASFPNVLGIPVSCFMSCSKLTTISAPKCKVIDANAFNGCVSLYSINIPLVERVNASAFYYCSSKLSTINFSYCSYVGSYAFGGCYSLSTVYLPKCMSFGSSAFVYCNRLISLYLNEVSSVPTFGSSMFYSTPISNYSTIAGQYGSIFVPSSLYADFITASGWSTYSARMVSV